MFCAVRVDRAAGNKFTQVKRGKAAFVRQRRTVTGDLPGQIVADDVLIQQRVVLRFRFERKYAHCAGHCRPDRVHADIGADIDQHLLRLESRDPFKRIRLLVKKSVYAPARRIVRRDVNDFNIVVAQAGRGGRRIERCRYRRRGGGRRLAAVAPWP